MHIHFEPVTEMNREAILALEIHENQKGFIESIEDCLLEASKIKCWRPVGIYDDTSLIGFAMYGFFWQYLPFGRVWLDRFLIDKRYQGYGYGKAVFPLLVQRLQQEYGRKKLYLSVTKDNAVAAHLYQQFGFRYNGQRDIHGEHVMVLKE